MVDFLAAHRGTLDRALQGIRERSHWSAYPEVPSGKIYGETAKSDAEAAFNALLNARFELGQPTETWIGEETSPWGPRLGITYPAAAPDTLVRRAEAALQPWAEAAPETRAGVALEILHRLNLDSFLMANAVTHTAGQAFVMAFQAGGPHAQDRALEAI